MRELGERSCSHEQQSTGEVRLGVFSVIMRVSGRIKFRFFDHAFQSPFRGIFVVTSNWYFILMVLMNIVNKHGGIFQSEFFEYVFSVRIHCIWTDF